MKAPYFRRKPCAPRYLAMAFLYAESAKLACGAGMPYWLQARFSALADAAFWIAGGDHDAAREALGHAAYARRAQRAVLVRPDEGILAVA